MLALFIHQCVSICRLHLAWLNRVLSREFLFDSCVTFNVTIILTSLFAETSSLLLLWAFFKVFINL